MDLSTMALAITSATIVNLLFEETPKEETDSKSDSELDNETSYHFNRISCIVSFDKDS